MRESAKAALLFIKTLLNPKYDQTRCPVCLYIVFVDGNGNMIEHPGRNRLTCLGSGRNDEDLAEELDAARPEV